MKVQSYINSQNKEQPYYELNKYQFMLYVMHIRGFEELKTKIIKDYEAMEKYIIQTNQEEQFKKFREKLDILEKENDVYNKDSNFYSIRDIRELLGGESIEIDTNKLKEMSYKLGLSIKQEKGYFNSKLTYYNRYHFLVWAKTYEDIFEITSDEKLRIKNTYDELNNLKN